MVILAKLWRKRWKVKPPPTEPGRPLFTYKKKGMKLGKKKQKKGNNCNYEEENEIHVPPSFDESDLSPSSPTHIMNSSDYYYGTLDPNIPDRIYDDYWEDEDEEQQTARFTREFSAEDSIMIRLLIMSSIYIVSYLGIAVLAYSYWLEPDWTIIDSLYFATNLYTTVGQGDKEPQTPISQAFTVCMSVYGVIVLGVFIGVLGHFVSEKQSQVLETIKDKSQNTILTKLMQTAAQEQRKQEQEEQQKKREQKASPLKPRQLQETSPLTGQSWKSTQSTTLSINSHFQDDEANTNTWWADFTTLLKDIGQVLKTEFPEIFVVVLLAFYLGYREGWSVISTLYFTIMSASTTGFGDFVPATQLDKLYCVFFLPLSVAILGEVLGRIATVYLQRKTRQHEAEFLRQTITLCDLRRMDANGDHQVDMAEFLTFMLVALQKVDPQDLEDLKATFHALDANGNGCLDRGDLMPIGNAMKKAQATPQGTGGALAWNP